MFRSLLFQEGWQGYFSTFSLSLIMATWKTFHKSKKRTGVFLGDINWFPQFVRDCENNEVIKRFLVMRWLCVLQSWQPRQELIQCNDAEILALGKKNYLEWFVFQWLGFVWTRIPNELIMNCMVKHSMKFSLPEWCLFHRFQRFSLEWTNMDTVNYVYRLNNGQLTKGET